MLVFLTKLLIFLGESHHLAIFPLDFFIVCFVVCLYITAYNSTIQLSIIFWQYFPLFAFQLFMIKILQAIHLV